MADLHSFDLFCSEIAPSQVVRAEVSRLVIDVERFPDDAHEPMASVGMGMVYERTHDGKALRHAISPGDRQALLQTWYEPHHERLNAVTRACLNKHGKCLVVDCHGFSSQPLPYEKPEDPRRPQICIGTHELHTPAWLVDAFEDGFWQQGFSVGLNHPFAGCVVPSDFHGKEPRVMSVMLEIRKDLYMDELTGQRLPDFVRISNAVRTVLCALAD